jgi:hypothetical protein
LGGLFGKNGTYRVHHKPFGLQQRQSRTDHLSLPLPGLSWLIGAQPMTDLGTTPESAETGAGGIEQHPIEGGASQGGTAGVGYEPGDVNTGSPEALTCATGPAFVAVEGDEGALALHPVEKVQRLATRGRRHIRHNHAGHGPSG